VIGDVPRRPWIGTSWKMNKTRNQAAEYLTELEAWAAGSTWAADLAVFPPFTALAAASAALGPSAGIAAGPRISLGAQNMHWAQDGAHTGEVSAAMIADCGATLVELGHVERRAEAGETDSAVNRKAAAAVAHGLTPVICVGDTAADRGYGVAVESVTRQVKIALHGLPATAVAATVLAYEPAWAIGTSGTRAAVAEVEELHAAIRAAVAAQHGGEAAAAVRIVYGGSVDAASTADYARGAGVDGLFIGRAALTAEGFVRIAECFREIRDRAMETVGSTLPERGEG
jgi:triosephosphate isomerase